MKLNIEKTYTIYTHACMYSIAQTHGKCIDFSKIHWLKMLYCWSYLQKSLCARIIVLLDYENTSFACRLLVYGV